MAGFGVIGSRPLSFGLSTMPTKTMSPVFGILLIACPGCADEIFSSVDAHLEK
jgi:hypothetical protein